jgi:hypothetical protein
MIIFLAMLIIPIALVLVPLWLGTRLGIRFKKKAKEMEPHAPVGSLVGAALGLLAFMLALTFQITASRFDTRKQLLLDEVTTMRTAYLRAGLLKEANRNECRKLLSEYVDLRVMLASDSKALQKVISRSKEIQDKLWLQVEALAGEDRSSEIYALFTTSINELIDLHNRRVVVALQYRIPGVIMYVLYFISFLSMLVLGFQFGISGKSNILINLALALIFSVVMWLIFALDNTEVGIKVNPLPVFNLQKEIRELP